MQTDALLRMGIFLGVLIIMASLEAAFPRKKRTQRRSTRWATNLSLVIIDSLALRLLGPLTAVAAAQYAMNHSWGLLPRFPLPYYLDVVLGFVLLDFAIYGQHILTHKIPLLWRLHRVHHTDRDIDVTTGIRFHPIEILLSMLYKSVIVILLGPLTISVVIFEILLNASALFNHANLKLPLPLDRILRLLIVTPDVHRVHHSVIPKETNSNYGFCLSIWDRLFGTYIAQPEQGHDIMQIGLQEWQTDSPSYLKWSLSLPFQKNDR